MKFKRWILSLLLAIAAVGCTVAAACGPDEIPEGPETGVYYTGVEADEYTLSLFDGNKVSLWYKSDNKTGTYVVSGETLTLKFSETDVVSATMDDDVITLTYDGSDLRFLKKVPYTVTFDSRGGSAVASITVVNGKTLSKPQDPVKNDSAFIGWYEDENYTVPFAFGSKPVTGNITLYAQWAETLPGQSVYEIEFDFRDGETANKKVNTVGGKLYNVETPVREGYTFKGWWLSDYDNAEKLTSVYTSETVFTSDATLFAEWQASGETKTGVYVNANGVSWDAISSGATLGVKGPDGYIEIKDYPVSPTSATSLAIDFAEAPAGEYVVSFTVGGTTTTRYYNNKALDRVSGITVTGNSMLVYRPVDNAEKYLVTVDCGNKFHVHDSVDNGKSTSFGFSGCEMQEGGIKFTVTAQADGYSSSVSKVFVFDRTLEKAEGLSYDEATATLVWDAVPGAMNYFVQVNDEDAFDAGNKTSVCLKEYTGELNVKVIAAAKGFNNSEAAEIKVTRTALASPKNLKINVDMLTWDAVDGASSYEIKINNRTFTSDVNSFNLVGADVSVDWQHGEAYVISVTAVGGVNSLASDELDARYYAMGRSLTYSAGKVFWNPAIMVSEFNIKVNGINVKTVEAGDSFAEVTLTRAGINTITVSFNDGAYSGEASIEVFAFRVTLDVRGGDSIENATLYKAVGDPMVLPETEFDGYEFAGWYNVPGGAESNGEKYGDEFFAGNADTVLYAYWYPREYTVTLDYGNFGEGNTQTAQVRYTRNFTLPVPTVTDGGKAFVAWCATADGNGTRYTDETGRSIRTWPHKDGATLYAYYADAVTFETDGNGYTVKAGQYIDQIKNLVIPAEYNGKKVVSIAEYGFRNCNRLETVSIPNTVRTIADTAFQGCTAMTAYIVREIEGVADPVYSADKGTLIYKNNMSGAFEIAAIPVTFTGTYTVPSGVTALGRYTFNGSRLSTIIIPESVTKVFTDAFNSCPNLETITFAGSVNAETANKLEFADGAINLNCAKLKVINFPARLSSFGGDVTRIFSAYKHLTQINVEKAEGVTQVYSSLDGVLLNGTGDTVLYCPISHKGNEKDEHGNYLNSGKYIVPASVSMIGANAFNSYYAEEKTSSRKIHNAITSVEFHSNIVSIGEQAFFAAAKLESVLFRGGARPLGFGIGDRAFYNCTRLSSIVFEETGSMKTVQGTGGTVSFEYEFTSSCGVRTIGEQAFYNCAESKILLPSTLTEIKKSAFESNKNLDEIDLSHVRSDLVFGEYVFRSCSSLKYIEITDNVGYIPFNSVFFGCNKLQNFDVSPTNPNYETDGDGVLYNKGKTEISFYPDGLTGPYTIPATVIRIGGGVFQGKGNIKEITIPKSVIYIGAGAFRDCYNLTSVTFEGGAGGELEIGDEAFYNCQGISTIELPERTRSIGKNCFRMSGKAGTLSSVTLNEGLEVIGNGAFHNQIELESITIPSTLKKLGDSTPVGTVVPSGDVFAMSGLRYIEFAPVPNGATAVPLTFANGVFVDSLIEEIELPERLTAIPENTFKGNKKLERVVVPTTVADTTEARGIGKSAFFGCSSLSELKFTLGGTEPLSFGEKSLQGCSSLEVLNLPARVSGFSSIYDVFAFGGDMQLSTYENKTDVFCNNSLAQVGNAAGVSEINVLEEDGITPKFSSYDGVLYTADRAEVVLCPIQKSGVVTIAKEATTFRANAFANCKHITEIKFQTGGTADFVMTGTGQYGYERVFWGCENLGKITFPARLVQIGKGALESDDSSFVGDKYVDGTNLTEVVFEEGCRLTEIGDGAFTNTNISAIELPALLTTVGKTPFAECDNLRTITLGKSMNAAALSNVIASVPALESVNLSDEGSDYLSVVDGVVYDKDATSLVYCPQGKTAAEYTIPGTVTEIPMGAFTGNKGIEKIIFAPGTEELTIGESAFSNSAIREIELPARVNSLGKNIFQNCKSLTTFSFATGYEYANIPQGMFQNCSLLGEIDIPDFVTAIEANAFNGCTVLERVGLGQNSNLVSLGVYAFSNCKNLDNVTLPSSLEKMGIMTTGADPTIKTTVSIFKGCTSLSSIVIPDKVKVIGQNMFDGCTNLQSVTFPSNLTGIGLSAFLNCTSLGSVEFNPTGQIVIDREAFKNCTSLSSLSLNGVKELNVYAFQGCTSLTSVIVPASVTAATSSTGQSASLYPPMKGVFKDCTSLVTVVYNTTLDIMESMFENCTALESVKIAAGVKNIDDSAFKKCGSALPAGKYFNVEFADGSQLATIGKSVFEGCSTLKSISLPDSVTKFSYNKDSYTKSSTSNLFKDCTSLESFVVPAGLKIIAASVFENCTSLSDITLTANITDIGAKAFKNCGVTEITVPSSVVSYGANLFEGSSLETVTLEGSANLGSSMFLNCTSLKNVTLNDGIQSIGAKAFMGCTSLVGIDLPEQLTTLGSTSLTSAAQVFEGCTSLFGITIPAGVKVIACQNFKDCTSLRTVEILGDNIQVGRNAFQNCTSLGFKVPEGGPLTINDGAVYSGTTLLYYFGGAEQFTVKDNTTKIAAYAFENNTTIKNVILPDNALVIETYAFNGCTSLEEINLQKVTEIGTYAFQKCSSLANVAFTQCKIGDNAFLECTGLLSVDLTGVTTIGSNAFKKCTSLGVVDVPSTVTKLGGSAFADCTGLITATLNLTTGSDSQTSWFNGCTSLESVTITGTLRVIGNRAFQKCTSLKTVILPESLTTLGSGYGVFNDCTSLESIVIPSKVTALSNSLFVGCSALKALDIKGNITSIGRSTFSGCSSMTFRGVNFASVTSIDSSAFENCTGIVTFTVPDKVSKISDSTFKGCTNLESIQLPAALTSTYSGTSPATRYLNGWSIGVSAFENCTSLKSIAFNGANDISLNNNAFKNCTSLETVDMTKVLVIRNNVFEGCTGLKTLTNVKNLKNTRLSSSVNVTNDIAIGTFAFKGCAALTSFAFEGTEPITIGANAFEGCTSLATVDLTGISAVRANAFKGCTAVTELVIPAAVTEIGANAFEGWTAQQSISIPEVEEGAQPASWDADWNAGCNARITWKEVEVK